MPILSGDIKLVASQVMDDVPEGGGAPTATVVQDGVSNAIFPDISELDRAGGKVSLRKLHLTVQTDDRDTYMGSNMIVAEPPADPNVSITLFPASDPFEQRTNATVRVEAYLTKGGEYAGYLFENHIAGQRNLQIFQRPETPLPAVGQTLVLIESEDTGAEKSQYVRLTTVDSEIRTSYDAASGDFKGLLVNVGISDALRFSFKGSGASRTFTRNISGSRLRETLVADAGLYSGVVPLTSAAQLGDFTVNASSIYTQLVPSAQTETAISDVRTNGLSTALVATGDTVSQTVTLAFTTSQQLFVGGPIYPGSLTVTRSGVSMTDEGGLLIVAAQEVGQVDYDNGILSLSTNVWGTTGGAHVITFKPATVPDLISDQRAIRVTLETRSLTYTFVMGDIPVPRSLSVSYLAQGRWYVLRDNGAGVLSGISSAYGVGTLSYSTGSVSFTLGALPDVGSSIIVQSYSAVSTVKSNNTLLLNGGRVYVSLNSDGLVSEDRGAKPFVVGKVVVSWAHEGVTQYAYDNGLGALSGDATGVIDYARGVLRLSPALLPAPDTVYNIGHLEAAYASAVQAARIQNSAPAVPVVHTIPGTPGYTIAAHTESQMVALGDTTMVYPAPGTTSIERYATVYYESASMVGGIAYQPSHNNRAMMLRINDDGQGGLFTMVDGERVTLGSIDYNASTMVMGYQYPMSQNDDLAPAWLSVEGYAKTWNQMVAANPTTSKRTLLMYGTGMPQWIPPEYVYTPPEYEDVWVEAVDVPATNPTTYTDPLPEPNPVAYTGANTVASVVVSAYQVRALSVPNYTLKGVSFKLGTTGYQQLTDGVLLRDVVPTTGGGTPAGAVAGATGVVTIQSWPTGASPVLTDWRGLIAPPSVGVAAPFSAFATIFRTATSPIRPGSLSVLGTMQDGTAFNVTAEASGLINGTRVKGRVDYQYGLVELYFVNPNGDAAYNTDLSFLNVPGLSTTPADLVMLNSLRYSAVAYSYLPLDAELLGIDPVRLPSDGRVPIFRAGGFAVVGHTGKITATVSNGQTLDCARVRLSRVRVLGFDESVINTGYTADLEAGTVTFTDVAGYSQPITLEHRVEDMAVVNQAQISGEITLTRPLTHDYPVGSYVSSAVISGDLKSRVSHLFDQATWTASSWADTPSGATATGTFNTVIAPVVVTNRGTVTERWALQMTSTTAFNIIGEHVGVIGTGTINADCAPINPATGVPYFTVPALGWGVGWSVGNVLRLNTVGAMFPVWCVRTVQQGPNTGTEHSFTLLSRGDVDRV